MVTRHYVKHPKGQEPWVLAGLNRNTWYSQMGREKAAAEKAATAALTMREAARMARPQTVNVTLRSTVDQHNRLRDFAHVSRRSMQDIVSDAVDAYLDAKA